MTNTKKRDFRSLYPILVYLLIAVFGVILILIPVLLYKQSVGDLLLNLGSGFIGASLVFFVLRFFLLDRDNEIDEKIDKLIKLVERDANPFFLARQELGTSAIIENFSKASKADFCGYALNRLVEEAQETLQRKLQEGCKVRILLVGNEGLAHKLIQGVSTSPASTHDVNRTFSLLREVKEKINKTGKHTNLEVRSLEWIPSCGLHIFYGQAKNHKYGWMQVEIYPPNYNTSPGNRPVFFLENSQENKWFEYYSDQFDQLWHSAEVVKL